MNHPGDVYEKIVFWSDEDNCFIGLCPELFAGGVHGNDAVEVFQKLLEVVEEWIEIYKKDGTPLPEPRSTVLMYVA